ncbi:protein REDOX 2-like [Lycium ferocissimum]|uniref:protein REDOX 2-like n=1 Tax=Lycium ferocissimum TaxID=112874 RepID=UPI002815DB87|nr:protein REDOX 2-like [Lycium ferocissimum]
MAMDMKEMLIPRVKLNSGHEMPLIGMGTAPALPPHDQLVSTLVDAIEAGYRHFDTAALYGSEEALGRAIVEALQRGLIKSREDAFITSKLWCTDAHPDLVLPALNRTLGTLGMDYLDLYLIHLPVRLKKKVNSDDYEDTRIEKEDVIPFDMIGTWQAMEECCRLGLAKSIGVSNFSCTKLSKLLHNATIPPAVNQVEMHVAWRQEKMLEFCKEKGIRVSAWSPLGANGISQWGNNAVMHSPVLKDIAIYKHKTVAQVALRWVYEQGASVIVKSFNKDRMKENLHILDWELSNEEVTRIQEIPPCTGFNVELIFVHPNGPFKSVDQFWDGEPEI